MRMRRKDITRLLSVVLFAVIAVSACLFVQHAGHIHAYPEDCPVCQALRDAQDYFALMLLPFIAVFLFRGVIFAHGECPFRSVGFVSLVSQNIRMNN